MGLVLVPSPVLVLLPDTQVVYKHLLFQKSRLGVGKDGQTINYFTFSSRRYSGEGEAICNIKTTELAETKLGSIRGQGRSLCMNVHPWDV
jgi:hypothetical protein